MDKVKSSTFGTRGTVAMIEGSCRRDNTGDGVVVDDAEMLN